MDFTNDSFYIVPKHGFKHRDSQEEPSTTVYSSRGVGPILRRIRLINGVCEGTEHSHETGYSHIVKLCRLCITDICNELTKLINEQTEHYKDYTMVLAQINEKAKEFPHPIPEKSSERREEIIKSLHLEIATAKHLYNKYNATLTELKKKKLAKGQCVVCEQVKSD